tara:strand:+ start:404 stop:652 length:249 start_codon:yes stop_codon:yes gene_type:complete
MEAKDGSTGFDFEGIYSEVKPNKSLSYKLSDGRRVSVIFNEKDNNTLIKESFEAENQNSRQMQQEGWQAILNNFKKYAENLK